MLDAHQAVLTGALRPTESRALSQDPDGKGRSSRSPSVWMQYVDPPLGTLLTVRDTCQETPILAKARGLFSLGFQPKYLNPIPLREP